MPIHFIIVTTSPVLYFKVMPSPPPSAINPRSKLLGCCLQACEKVGPAVVAASAGQFEVAAGLLRMTVVAAADLPKATPPRSSHRKRTNFSQTTQPYSLI